MSLFSSINNKLTTDKIINILNNISKNIIHEDVINFIKENTTLYNRCRLIQKND